MYRWRLGTPVEPGRSWGFLEAGLRVAAFFFARGAGPFLAGVFLGLFLEEAAFGELEELGERRGREEVAFVRRGLAFFEVVDLAVTWEVLHSWAAAGGA